MLIGENFLTQIRITRDFLKHFMICKMYKIRVTTFNEANKKFISCLEIHIVLLRVSIVFFLPIRKRITFNEFTIHIVS